MGLQKDAGTDLGLLGGLLLFLYEQFLSSPYIHQLTLDAPNLDAP